MLIGSDVVVGKDVVDTPVVLFSVVTSSGVVEIAVGEVLVVVVVMGSVHIYNDLTPSVEICSHEMVPLH